MNEAQVHRRAKRSLCRSRSRDRHAKSGRRANGTYPLQEIALDRCLMGIKMGYPSTKREKRINSAQARWR